MNLEGIRPDRKSREAKKLFFAANDQLGISTKAFFRRAGNDIQKPRSRYIANKSPFRSDLMTSRWAGSP